MNMTVFTITTDVMMFFIIIIIIIIVLNSFTIEVNKGLIRTANVILILKLIVRKFIISITAVIVATSVPALLTASYHVCLQSFLSWCFL